MRQNKNEIFYIGGSGLDWTNDFQKFRRSGLDQIQFYRIKTGLGLKNFTVRSSLSDSHLSATLLCYLRVTGAKTSLRLTAYWIE